MGAVTSRAVSQGGRDVTPSLMPRPVSMWFYSCSVNSVLKPWNSFVQQGS